MDSNTIFMRGDSNRPLTTVKNAHMEALRKAQVELPFLVCAADTPSVQDRQWWELTFRH